MKHLKTYSIFEAQALTESEYRNLDKNYVMDNFKVIPNNTEIYDAREADFSDLPWFQAMKAAFPSFKLDRVRKKSGGYSWFFSALESRKYPVIYEVYRPGDKGSPSEDVTKIVVNNGFLFYPTEDKIYLNDKESWNQIFKIIYFGQSAGSLTSDPGRSLNHIMKLFSTDLENFYKTGDLGIVGIKKNCNPYGGHYKSEVNMLKNLPYGIFDDIKAGFIKGIKETPGKIQYAISQSQLPDSSSEKDEQWNSRLYPQNEVSNFYNHLKSEGYVPPAGFEEETEEISGIHKSLGDIGL